jgi:hypothetical protein
VSVMSDYGDYGTADDTGSEDSSPPGSEHSSGVDLTHPPHDYPNLTQVIDLWTSFPPQSVADCYDKVNDLIEEGNIDKLNNDGFSPLEVAVDQRDLILTLVLLQNGANIWNYFGFGNILDRGSQTLYSNWTITMQAVVHAGIPPDKRL